MDGEVSLATTLVLRLLLHTACFGARLMGHGIAQEFSLAGYEVCLNDLTEEKPREALKNVQESCGCW